jgi:inositol-pentakisphosphate 2-kinase
MAEAKLPESVVLTYLAEGAANVVYKIHLPAEQAVARTPPIEAGSIIESYGPTTPPPTEIEEWDVISSDGTVHSFLKDRVLRLRKDMSTATPVLEAQKNYEDLIAPLFEPKHLIQQISIEMPKGVIKKLNSELGKMDVKGHRHDKRHSSRLKDEKFGTLTIDMSMRDGEDLTMVEIKPKWLVQSPSAPPGAKRCRTCALRALRNSKGNIHEGFCPLDLLSKDVGVVQRALTFVLEARHGNPNDMESVARTLANFLIGCQLLPELAKQQRKLDLHGPIQSDTRTEDFRLAMTLRDCTLFLRVRMLSQHCVLYCNTNAWRCR